ncbi:alpha/beta fold hydrolase [Nocardiopsis alba]|uniref:alpha/beta fold hydrolase n=1 Tax=Nocardiopsis alba TaxID=53437 RepID=UPI003BA001DD
MTRTTRTTALTALLSAVAVTSLTGCSIASEVRDGLGEVRTDLESAAEEVMTEGQLFTGTKMLEVEGGSVNVSCSGAPVQDRPVIVLMAGMGDGLDTLADIQETLSEQDRVCSYDRFGEGESDQPTGPQTIDDGKATLRAVLDDIAGDQEVVLAGHSLGGLIAARYAPDDQDRVKGLVLLDATSPTMIDDITGVIPSPPPVRAPRYGRRTSRSSRARTRRTSPSRATRRCVRPGTSRWRSSGTVSGTWARSPSTATTWSACGPRARRNGWRSPPPAGSPSPRRAATTSTSTSPRSPSTPSAPSPTRPPARPDRRLRDRRVCERRRPRTRAAPFVMSGIGTVTPTSASRTLSDEKDGIHIVSTRGGTRTPRSESMTSV